MMSSAIWVCDIYLHLCLDQVKCVFYSNLNKNAPRMCVDVVMWQRATANIRLKAQWTAPASSQKMFTDVHCPGLLLSFLFQLRKACQHQRVCVSNKSKV